MQKLAPSKSIDLKMVNWSHSMTKTNQNWPILTKTSQDWTVLIKNGNDQLPSLLEPIDYFVQIFSYGLRWSNSQPWYIFVYDGLVFLYNWLRWTIISSRKCELAEVSPQSAALTDCSQGSLWSRLHLMGWDLCSAYIFSAIFVLKIRFDNLFFKLNAS